MSFNRLATFVSFFNDDDVWSEFRYGDAIKFSKLSTKFFFNSQLSDSFAILSGTNQF